MSQEIAMEWKPKHNPWIVCIPIMLAAFMFVFADDKLKNYKEKTNKPVYKILSPFVWYKKKNKILEINL